MVVEVTLNDRLEPLTSLRHWIVHSPTELLLNGAVGTTIADRPPHRSVRARSRIRLLSWMRGGEASLRVRVQNSWERNPAFQQRR
jgi:hypothetical protein